MAKGTSLDKVSVYVPQRKAAEQPVERLEKLGKTRARSISRRGVEAVLQGIEREEKRSVRREPTSADGKDKAAAREPLPHISPYRTSGL